MTGCPSREPAAESKQAAKPLAGMKLRLVVVDDPALATAVTNLQGEWNVQTGAEIEVDQKSQAELEAAESLPADAVICPAHLFGTLAERDLLAPAPRDLLESSEWADLFDLLKLRESAWSTKTLAVPFGSPVLTCYYRADLLDKLGRRPPQTWTEYQELAEMLAAQKPPGDAPWSGALEPLAPGWAGLTFLARAAAYAKHRDNYSTLFNIDTMAPLLDTPAMAQALEELVAVAKLNQAAGLTMDPQAVRAAFWKGQCGMALTWPTAVVGTSPDAAIPEQIDPNLQVGFAELPGAKRVYNLSTRAWDLRAENEDVQVPLLDITGRLGVVNKSSPHVNGAFHLLLWLSDNRMSAQVSAASDATTIFRRSQVGAADRWVEKPIGPAAATQYAETVQAALCREQWLSALPLPGRAEYLAALDEAVQAAVRGQQPAAEALLQANAKWQEITERLGTQRQRAAYRHSLGW